MQISKYLHQQLKGKGEWKIANGWLIRCVYAMCLCACQLRLLVPTGNCLMQLTGNRFVYLFHSLLFPVSNLLSYLNKKAICVYRRWVTISHSRPLNLVLFPCVLHHQCDHHRYRCRCRCRFSCIECTFSSHPQRQNDSQSEHFSHSLPYSLAYTCEHDNRTPFVCGATEFI